MGLLVIALVLGAGDLDRVVVRGESKPTATRLAEALRLHAEGKSDRALNVLIGLLESGADDLIVLSPDRSVRAREQVHAAIARLGPDGLAAYRRRAEGQANRWLDEGQDRRVVDEAFCSAAAATALDRLGDAAFRAGRFDEAGRWWACLAPLDDAPQGPVYPDPKPAQVARARAKQLLARRFAGCATWEADLARFRKRHPRDAGRLAGAAGVYADLLARTPAPADDAPDWATFGGAPSRGRAPAGPDRLLDRLSRLCRSGPTWAFDLSRREPLPAAVARVAPHQALDAARRLAYHPALAGSTAFVSDGRRVTAYDLRTGTATEWFDAKPLLKHFPAGELPIPRPDIRYTLTVAAGHVFARLGASTVRDIRPGGGGVSEDSESLIVCLKDGKECWHAHAVDAGRKEFAVFEGAPLVAGERCYVAASRFEGDRVVTAIHCYPAFAEARRPAPLWKADVCETRELQTAGTGEGRKARARHHLLTLAAGQVVYCSHSGVVAALDPISGARLWARRYPRREEVEVEDEPALRDLAPPLAADGRLYLAPADSDRLLCLDPVNGSVIWQRDRLDVVHLLGAGGGRLLFTTWRNPSEGLLDAGGLRAVDAATGRDEGGWMLPDAGGGLIPFGRGQLVGDLVLWPTYRQPFGVFAVRQSDGRQPDNPTLLHRIPPGNLVYAGGTLLVTDRQAMYAFVPPEILDDARGDPAREKVGRLLREKRFDAVLADEALGRIDARDERGLPQAAATLAGRALKAGPKPLTAESFGAVDVRLRADEAFLPLAGGEAFLTARPGEVVRRTAKGVAWETRVGFTPDWAAVSGPLFVVAGPGGLAGLTADGAEAWHWPPPALPRYPTSFVAAVRVHADVTPAEPLHGFRLDGATVYAAQGGRLFALDARTGRCRWAHEASAFGQVLTTWPMGEAVLAQVSRRRLLIDAATGRLLRRDADSRGPWPREPLDVEGDAVMVAASDRVRRVGRDGASRWEYRPPGKTTRTGEPPVVLPWGKELVVVVPENIGPRLRFLDGVSGRPSRPDAPLLEGVADPGSWQIHGDTVYHAAEGRLRAWGLPAGRPRWNRPTGHDGRTRLAMAGGSMLTWPAEGPAVRFIARWRWAAVQWRAGPWPGEADEVRRYALAGPMADPVTVRLNPLRLPRYRDAAEPGGVIPMFGLDRRATAPGPVVQVGPGGVLCSLGDHVRSLQPLK